MLLLLLLLTNALALEIRFHPEPTYTAEDYVAYALNRVPYAQARLTADGRVAVSGPLQLDLGDLDPQIAREVADAFHRVSIGSHPDFPQFDLSRARLEIRGYPPQRILGPAEIAKSKFHRDLLRDFELLGACTDQLGIRSDTAVDLR